MAESIAESSFLWDHKEVIVYTVTLESHDLLYTSFPQGSCGRDG